MAAKVTIKGNLPIAKIAKSPEILAQLEPLADDVMDDVSQDPDKVFTATLRKHSFVSSGRGGRASWQVGAAPKIGERVEAKRGPFSRALGRLGLN